jgi:hypothetical protein
MLQNLQEQGRRSDAPYPSQRWMSWSWLAVVVGGFYILSAKLSLSLLTPDGVAVFWPAAGISAGALIAFGPPARWAVTAGTMVATIVANLLGDRNILGRPRLRPVQCRGSSAGGRPNRVLFWFIFQS